MCFEVRRREVAEVDRAGAVMCELVGCCAADACRGVGSLGRMYVNGRIPGKVIGNPMESSEVGMEERQSTCYYADFVFYSPIRAVCVSGVCEPSFRRL